MTVATLLEHSVEGPLEYRWLIIRHFGDIHCRHSRHIFISIIGPSYLKYTGCDTFIVALRRFIARRGFYSTIHSDNVTNFIGANNELRELHDLLQSDDHNEKVNAFLANKQIEWRFIPPHSPHFGGLLEVAVKSFKHHLKRVVGNELLAFVQFNTLIIEIESILNSRLLTRISTDPNNLLILTPGHFLIGDSLISLRERNFRDIPSNWLSRWQHIHEL